MEILDSGDLAIDFADPEENDELSKTLDLMERHGGAFVSSLATCIRKADLGNKTRLLRAFPEIFEQYGPSGIFWGK
jgi:hypothetical protein